MNNTSPQPRLRSLTLALALCGACALPAYAAGQAFPTSRPAPGPAPTLNIPTPSMQVLANGLKVVSARRAGLPLVTAQLLIRSGGEMDPADKAGLADLTAVLLTKGAAGKSAPEIAAAADAMGSSLRASSDWDGGGVAITVTTPKLPQALALLSDVVRHPDFAADELARAQTQAIDDLRLTLSRPTSLASLAAGRAVFGSGAYGHSRTGTPTSLEHIVRSDVQALHAALYRPDNAILVLAGDITPEQALALAQQQFGDWQAPKSPLPTAAAGRGDSDLPSLLLIDQHGAGQAGVVAAHAAPQRDDPGFYIGTVANAVLGGSYSARLNQEIRIKRGLSYGASSNLGGRRDSGLWLAAAQTKNPSAPQVVDLMLAEFQRLGTTPVAADELSARKATLVGGYGRSLETTSGLANQIADLATYGVDLAEVGRYIQRVQAVTPAQIQAYAAQHFNADGSKVVVVGDAALFAAELAKSHPQAVVLSYDDIDLDSPTLTAAP